MKFLSQINVNTEYTLPIVDGTNGQVLSTDGSGVAYWGTISAGSLTLDGLSDVVITSPASGQILRYGIPVGSSESNPFWHNWTHNFVTSGSAVTITGTQTITGSKTFTAATSMSIASGNDTALTITKGGNGEALYVNKTSGSGNAVTVIGTLNATNLVRNGGTSSQFLKADGSVDTSSYLTAHPGILAASSVNNSNGTVIQDITLETNGHVTGLASVNLDTRYYTESEIDSFFGGETEIDGYNRGAWDVAYNDKINSASFSTTTGVLTLTQQDTGTITVDLDGRYLESLPAHTHTIANVTGLQTALDGKAESSHGHNDATTSASGFMSRADKDKLDGIASGANNYSLPTATSTVLGGIKVGTNLSISSGILSATDTNTVTSVGIVDDLSTGDIVLKGGGATTITKVGGTITITSTDTDTNTTYSAGTGLTLSGTTFSVTANTFAAASHTHAASDITSGTLSTDRLPKQELGISIVGNFGQWQAHGAYTNLNTDVAYWGWNFVQGAINAPHQISSQWYRGRFSLGDEYGFGTSPGEYWMEIAIPRYNQSSTSGNLFVRTCENGGINAWQGVRAAYATDAAYAADAGYAEESGYSTSSGSVEWTNVQNKPATFPPSAHNHDDRYYTETESDSRFYLATNPSGYITSSGSITGHSGSLSADDNRTISPSEIGANQLKFGFTSWTNNNQPPYADYLHLRSYGDSSGGSDNLVMFKKSGIGMRIWQQTFGSGTAYSSYVDVWTTGDFSSTNISNWNTAYGWGDHAAANYASEDFVTSQGYITGYTEADTLSSVTGRGNTTTNSISVGSLSVPSRINLTGAGVDNAFISESWGINLNGVITHPIQVRGASFSVGYTLGGGVSYGNNNMFVAGSVGIGTTSPAEKLQVAGNVTVHPGQKFGWIYQPGTDNNMYNFIQTALVSGAASSPLEISGSRWTNSNTAGVIFTHQTGGQIMTIMTGGNVGIGTTAPESTLHVNNTVNNVYDPANTLSSGQTMRISNLSGTSGISTNLLFIAQGAGGGNGLGSISGVNTGTGSLALTFGTRDSGSNVTEKMRITSAGNVGIGTTAPAYKLEVSGTSYFSGLAHFGQTATSGSAFRWGTFGTAVSADTMLAHNQLWNGSGWTILSGSVGTSFLNLGGEVASPNIQFGTGPANTEATTKMIILNNGNVGIGTTAPSTLLHVNGVITATGGNSTQWNTAYGWGDHAGLYATKEFVTSQGYITGDYLPLTGGTLSGTLTMGTTGTQYIRMGRFPGSTVNTGEAWIGRASDRNTGTMTVQLGGNSASGRLFEVVDYAWSVVLFSVDSSGNLTTYGTITENSSIRYKKDVVDIESTSSKVQLLRPVKYKKIENDSEEIGLIAEDVAELFPEVVKYDNEGRPDGVNYSRLSVILLKAVQELTERVNKLENK